jgi:hypothetical protein
VNFVASFGINTIAAGIVYELNASVCSLFNQVCQLFSINMASVLILVKFNTVYDSFSRCMESVFLVVLLFRTVVTEQLKLIEFLLLLSAFNYSSIFPSFPDFKQLLI